MQAGSPFIQITVKDYDPNCWQWVTRTYTNTVENIHSTDGIVIQPSQQALVGAIIPLPLPSTNHEEAKRGWSVVNYLRDEVFEKPGYFKLEKK